MIPRSRLRRLVKPAVVVIVAAGWLGATVDDWSRDFEENHAEIGDDSTDPTLRPLRSERSAADLAEGLKWAARRIGTWELTGTSQDGNTTVVTFVRRAWFLGPATDVTLRIEDHGRRRVITGESRSRNGFGDLGQNPRNLRRILGELQAVLQGTRHGPLT
jgi:hypothetical protein